MGILPVSTSNSIVNEVGERVIEGLELIEVTNEKVTIAKEKLKETRSRQKSYAEELVILYTQERLEGEECTRMQERKGKLGK
nr:putative nucleotidyltransferase, ribonuclease H [Tanacetum cinerariifolium]